MARTFDVDARAAAIVTDNTIPIDGVVFRPVPVTPPVRRELRAMLNRIKRCGRRATAAERRIKALESAADERETAMTDAEEETLEQQIAEQERLQEEADTEAEELTRQLIAAQIADDAGNHPTAELIAARVPAQLQKAMFEFLSGVGDDDESGPTTATTPANNRVGSTPT